jgi:uncharacterized membrane protein
MNGKIPRRLAVALALSLAFNLFLAGMIAAGWLAEGERISAARERPPRIFRHGLEGLDEDMRPAVEEARRRHAREIVPLTREMRAARREMRQALAAPELDEKRLQAAFEELRRRSHDAQAAVHALMLEIARTLDPAQRKQFFERVRPRHLMHRRDRPPPPPPAE